MELIVGDTQREGSRRMLCVWEKSQSRRGASYGRGGAGKMHGRARRGELRALYEWRTADQV